jgi:hypothetical protein
MRYRNLMMVALPALALLFGSGPRPAPTPEPQPSAAQIDAALELAASEAGLPAGSQNRRH